MVNNEKFVELAEKEHGALSTYCNSLSTLSHAISSKKPKINYDNSSQLDPISFIPQERKEESALMEYTASLRNLQLCHSKLTQCFQEILTNQDVNPTLLEAMKGHLELSERSLRTCASSTSRGVGPLHENGLIKNLTGNGDEDWHEIRIVTLVALRASISKLKDCVQIS